MENNDEYFQDADGEEEFIDFDFDINPDEKIEEKALKHFDDFESTEIELDSMMDETELVTVEEEKIEVRCKIPLCFVDETSIPEVTEETKKSKKNAQKYFCENCNKGYTRKGSYNNHIEICTKSSDIVTPKAAVQKQSTSSVSVKKKAEKTKDIATPKAVVQKPSTSSVSKKKKAKKAKALIQITENQVKDESIEIFKAILNELINDKIKNLRVGNQETPGNKKVALATSMLECIKQDNKFHECATTIIMHFFTVIKDTDFLKSSSIEHFWHDVLQKNEDGVIGDLFEPFFVTLKAPESIKSGVIFYISRQMIKHVIALNVKLTKTDAVNQVEECPITPEEEQTLYYVAGYIVFSLTKKYKKLIKLDSDNIAPKNIYQFLISVKNKGTSKISASLFSDFVTGWVEQVNRGGLICVNDEFYIFIKQIETIARSFMTVKFIRDYRGEDLRAIFHEKLESSKFVASYWKALSRKIPSDALANILFQQIINKWVDIRANAFVVAYVQIIKRKINSLSAEKKKEYGVESIKKSQPALRKTLT